MKNVLRIDHKNARIIMDREFTIAASIFGSPEYKMLQQAKQDNDSYHVVRKTIKKNPKKEAFKGLTYEYMDRYMDRYNVKESIRQEYQDMRFNVECHSIRYPKVKAWFLHTFPEVKNLGEFNQEADNADNAAAADEVA